MRIAHAITPFQHAINRTLTHFSQRFPMTRRIARLPPPPANPRVAVLPGVAMEDWDTLFTAVKARLTLIAQTELQTQTPHSEATARVSADAAQLARLCAGVLECVDALDQLHATARDTRVRAGQPSRRPR